MRLRDLFDAFNIIDAPFAVWDRLPQSLREWIKWTFAAMLLTANAWLAVITSAIHQWDPYATFFVILAGTVLILHLLQLLAKLHAWRSDRRNVAQYGYKNSIESVASLRKEVDEILRTIRTLSARIAIVSRPYELKLAKLQLPLLRELRNQVKEHREQRVQAVENAVTDARAAELFNEYKGERLADAWPYKFEAAGIPWDMKERFRKIEEGVKADKTGNRVPPGDVFKNADEKCAYRIIEKKYQCMGDRLQEHIDSLERRLTPTFDDWRLQD